MPKKINDSHIYDKTVDLFIQKGFIGTTTKEIAIKADVNETTLFRKYGNKETLLIKAIIWKLENVPLGKIEFSGDMYRDLELIVKAYIKTSEECGMLIPLIFIEVRKHKELNPVLKSMMKNIEVVQSILENYQNKGLLKKVNSEHILSSLLGGLFLLNLRPPEFPFMSTILDPKVIVDSFLGGYADNIAKIEF